MKDDLLDVFDIEKDTYIAKGAPRQAVADMLNITRDTISNCLTTGRKLKRRYIITISESQNNISPKDSPKIPVALLKEWDEMTAAAELIRTGQGYITTKIVDGKKVKVTVPKAVGL